MQSYPTLEIRAHTQRLLVVVGRTCVCQTRVIAVKAGASQSHTLKQRCRLFDMAPAWLSVAQGHAIISHPGNPCSYAAFVGGGGQNMCVSDENSLLLCAMQSLQCLVAQDHVCV